MTTERIEELYEASQEDDRDGEKNEVLKGLLVLEKYSDDISINPAHDEIFVGIDDYSQMTEEDVNRMFALGFRWDEESFAKFL